MLLELAGAYLLYKIFSGMKKDTSPTWDKYTNARINKLHPLIRDDARAFINEAAKNGYKLRITIDGHYRSFAEQKAIYAKGRTTPGRIVSSSKPGQSYHNYGLAIDVVEIKGNKALWKNPNWKKIGKIGKKYGFEWGGDWAKCKNCPDYPHFQKRLGKHHTELLTMYVKKIFRKDGYLSL